MVDANAPVEKGAIRLTPRKEKVEILPMKEVHRLLSGSTCSAENSAPTTMAIGEIRRMSDVLTIGELLAEFMAERVGQTTGG
jgi:hypothetical protein